MPLQSRIDGILRWMFKKTHRKRVIFFLSLDGILISLSMWVAFLLRFEGKIPPLYLENLWIFVLLSLFVKIFLLYFQGLYKVSWSYIGTEEVLSLVKALGYGFLILASGFFLLRTHFPFSKFPRSILFIDFFLSLVFVGSFRTVKRIYCQVIKHPPSRKRRGGERTLIVGAGVTGEQVVRNMLREGGPYYPVGFVDDDPMKAGITIHQVKVLGKCKDIPTLAKHHDIKTLLIAMPSASSKVIREIVRLGREAKILHIRIIPSLNELIRGEISLSDIREVKLEDLLTRKQVEIKIDLIKHYLKEKVVLVTGAGGSIGSELSRQILKFSPRRLILLDQDETSIFKLERELSEIFGGKILTIVGDIKDKNKIERVFSLTSPQVVFHAAAYKHVPVMEKHPDEAVKNNIMGTRIVGEVALKYGAEKFILISTDKAANPISVMGVTKRIAELLIMELNKRGKTKFSAVRFGNVLGSRGSVISIFKEQIKKGGPVTVTHPEMKRFFMTPSEAVLLVLEAGAIGEGGEIFVLDMGEPVKIVELARELIRLSGYEPDVDIPISFTGVRPGEKLMENIFGRGEMPIPTHHKKIFKTVVTQNLKKGNLLEEVEKLNLLADEGNILELLNLLKEMVSNYELQALKKEGFQDFLPTKRRGGGVNLP